MAYLLQASADAHLPQVVGEEGARAGRGVPGEQQPAEHGHVLASLHGAVQLGRAAQHQQLQSLHQPQLLLPALEHALAQPPPLLRRGAVRRRRPLEGERESAAEGERGGGGGKEAARLCGWGLDTV